VPTLHAWVPSTTNPASRIGTRRWEALGDRELEEPRMNPDRPELPELKGDFDWDERFGGDDNWIVENVPGKIVLNEIELATQVTALNKLEETWRKEREWEEYQDSLKTGFVSKAELANGRFAMFFLVTGLLTEYWTGVTIPGQVEELLRIAGVIGFDG
jgi:hypothetical protein